MRRFAALALFTALHAFPLTKARADEKQRCIAASEQGQELRDSGKYRLAREAFGACARSSCPSLVRRDCGNWQAELEESWPSLIVAANDGTGNDLVDVRVLLDGAPLLTKLDGQPARIDPGEHVLRCEADGYRAAEERVVVRAGEKGRVVRLQLVPLRAAPATIAAGDRAPAAPSGASGESTNAAGTKRTSAYVFGAISLTAFVSEAYFGLTGISDRNALMASPCAQSATCSPGSVDSIRTKFTVADISLGVGLASAALATYLYLTSARSEPKDPSAHSALVDFTPLSGGGAATMTRRW
jgi:hypothetical protein